ncbi:MAG: DUF763 domain-containing protein [Patescibacteria group bacterium]
MKRGIATFTLDTGKCPKWLFERMVKLGREMSEVLVAEYGPDEFIKRMADPVWFQSLGTVLAFDWNASGLTTILTAALKEAIRGQEEQLGVFICGGKGKTSRKTPEQITNWGWRLRLPKQHTENLVYNSRMSAKVDSSLIQDGYQIYHHTFFFSKNGAWTVVQQGMNQETQSARRYHWHSDNVKDLIVEPHTGIASQLFDTTDKTLNMTAQKSDQSRNLSIEMVNSSFQTVMKDIQLLRKHSSSLSQMLGLKKGQQEFTFLNLEDREFRSHPVIFEDFSKSKYLEKILWQVCDQKPESYEKFLAMEGVGPKTVRALALVGEVIYGADPSYEDPARYSFAHGGKDSTPYPVDCDTFDQSIEILRRAVQKTKLDASEKNKAVKRLINAK